jgi:hypothetical protein
MRRDSRIHRSGERESRKYAFAGSSLLRDAFQNAATWSVRRSDSYSARPAISLIKRGVSAQSRS